MREEHPHLQMAERADACQTLDKLFGPRRPLMLRLINITRRSERSWLLCRSSFDACDVDYQQLGVAILGKLCCR